MMKLLSEAFFQYVYDVLGFTHRVEMHCRNSMFYQFFTLHGAPFRTYPVYTAFIVLGLGNLFSQLQRNVDGKRLRK